MTARFPELPDLLADLLALVRQVPCGEVTSFGDLAFALGDDSKKSSRWIGAVLSNPHWPVEHDPAPPESTLKGSQSVLSFSEHASLCPCHRVVRGTGAVGLHWSRQAGVKESLLRDEGIELTSEGRVSTSERFTEFVTERPLFSLKQWQRQVGEQVRHLPVRKKISTLAGVDVAYDANGDAHAAFVLMTADGQDVLYEHGISQPCTFPYLPGFLTFRELPAMLQVCLEAAGAGHRPDVLLCDGNGQLHPWGAGIAVCLGVALGWPTVGIGKSRLCGKLSEETPAGFTHLQKNMQFLNVNDRIAGVCWQGSVGSKPLYVSVGHKLTLQKAVEITQTTVIKHRIPEPLFLADRLSKRLKHRVSGSR